MKLKTAFRVAIAAAKANLLPGILLQSLLVVFLAAYVTHEGTRQFLAQVENVKQESGYIFTFISYALSAAILPEILRIAFFQNCRIVKRNLWNILTGIPGWGCVGILVDFFYRCQIMWLGDGHDWATIVSKVLIDQFLFSPFLNTPLIIAYFMWRDAHFHKRVFREIFRKEFITDHVLPVQVAGWCIWIPGVSLIYFMPSGLQIPLAVLIQTFWVLVFVMVEKTPRKRH